MDIQSGNDIDRAHTLYYLQQHGWERTRSDELKEIWTSPSGTHVLVPALRLDDYGAVMAEVVGRISLEEGRAQDDVLVDLSWPGFDKLIARTRADRSSPAVPLQDALGLNGALRDLIVAAARSAERPQASFQGGWSTGVGAYFDQVRMIPSRPGSFALRALLPLNPEPPDELLVATVDTTSIRKVTRTLVSGVSAARQAAEQRVAGAAETVFEAAIEQGVSADLLDALVRLGGPESDPAPVELGVTWTYAAPEAPITPLRISAGLMPVLAQAADLLRDSPDEVTGTVTGTVVRLHRPAKLGPGEITIQGYVESNAGSSTRNIKMELDEVTYGQAIAAHRDGATVRVRCTIRYGSRLSVSHVESFAVTSD